MFEAFVRVAFNFIISQIGTILGIQQQLQQNTAHGAQEATPYRIDIGVFHANETLNDINWGLPNLHAQLTAIQTAIATRQSATAPVVLPTTPPTGYGGDTSGVAASVWSYVLGQGEDAGSALDDLYGSRLSLFANTFASLPGFPFMVAYSLNAWQNYAEGNIHPPAQLDASTILPSDASILAWANRTAHGTLGWTNTSFRGTTVPMQLDDNRSDVKWIITMTPQEFAAFKAVAPTQHILPVWPGLGKATFLTPHALADQLTITVPMDGIAIALDSVPSRLSFYQFDDLKSYRNLGAISFFTDNGDQEEAQRMGFDEAIYTPKTMVRAGGVKIRVTGGVVGTIYPWTINP